jgi:predicted negative regulator of RcsB-dependent stress response
MFARVFGKPSLLNKSRVNAIDPKTGNFRNALTAYKNAIENLTANANIYAKLNNVNNKNGTKYNEKLLRAIAKAFYQGQKAAAAVNSLKPGASEGPATQAVTEAASALGEVAAQIDSLNAAMSSYKKLNNNNVNAYITSGRNESANNALNKKRTEGGRYGNFFTRVAARKITKSALTKAASLNT